MPASAVLGTLMVTVGFQLQALLPAEPVRRKAVREALRDAACAAVAWPGVHRPGPELLVAGPDQ